MQRVDNWNSNLGKGTATHSRTRMALLRIKKLLIHNIATLGCQVLATKPIQMIRTTRLLRFPLEFFFVVQWLSHLGLIGIAVSIFKMLLEGSVRLSITMASGVVVMMNANSLMPR